MSIVNKIKIGHNVLSRLLLYKLFGLLPIKKNKVVFRSYHGTKYNDSPMAISEALMAEAEKRGFSIDNVWITNGKVIVPNNVRTVLQGSPKSIYELATAKVWVDNVRKDLWDRKRDEQYYIQTWHAGTALKMVEKDAEKKLPNAYIKRAINDSRMANAFISASKDNTKLYNSSFWYNGDIFEYGCPRSDIFYKEPDSYRDKVYKAFNLNETDHIALYAPTFRNDGSLKYYNIDYSLLAETIEKKWGGKWRIIVRLHPNLVDKCKDISYQDIVLNGSDYPEINDIIIACDLLITDYSSCMFDAMEAKKNVVLYASDEKEYMSERGTYYTLSQLPFPVAHNNSELMNHILNFSEEKYNHNVKKFMDNLGFVNDGSASEKCAILILDKMGVR